MNATAQLVRKRSGRSVADDEEGGEDGPAAASSPPAPAARVGWSHTVQVFAAFAFGGLVAYAAGLAKTGDAASQKSRMLEGECPQYGGIPCSATKHGICHDFDEVSILGEDNWNTLVCDKSIGEGFCMGVDGYPCMGDHFCATGFKCYKSDPAELGECRCDPSIGNACPMHWVAQGDIYYENHICVYQTLLTSAEEFDEKQYDCATTPSHPGHLPQCTVKGECKALPP